MRITYIRHSQGFLQLFYCLELASPVLEAYWAWVEENADKVLSKSKIGKAFQYTLNQRDGLMNYLKDCHCEISNNIAENSIRPFTVGRRNWLFSGSPKGASASAIVYSLVETAKANGLNPYKYLNLLLEILPRFSVEENPKALSSCSLGIRRSKKNAQHNSHFGDREVAFSISIIDYLIPACSNTYIRLKSAYLSYLKLAKTAEDKTDSLRRLSHSFIPHRIHTFNDRLQ